LATERAAAAKSGDMRPTSIKAAENSSPLNLNHARDPRRVRVARRSVIETFGFLRAMESLLYIWPLKVIF